MKLDMGLASWVPICDWKKWGKSPSPGVPILVIWIWIFLVPVVFAVLNQSTCSSVPACVAATRTSEQATIPHLPTSNEQVPDWFDSVEEFDI
jgi:hypothetical protein